MNDSTLSIVSAACELAVPLVLAVLLVAWPRHRRWAAVILGAITPLLLFFAFTTVGYLREEHGAQLAFPGMWFMSAIPYATCVALGAALSFIRVPRTASARYVLGLSPAAVLAIAWVAWLQR